MMKSRKLSLGLFWHYTKDMPLVLQQKAVAMITFVRCLERYDKLFQGLKSFQPYMTQLEDLRDCLTEGAEWIDRYTEGCLRESAEETGESEAWEDEKGVPSLDDVLTLLGENTASELEDALDSYPEPFRFPVKSASQEFERVCEDIESIGERLYEELRTEGYALHSVLIGAA